MDYNAPRAYEALIAPRYAPVAKRLVKQAQLVLGEKVLELGAGTGLVTREAARLVEPDGLFVATDRSAEMLALGRRIVGGRALFAVVDYAAPLPFLAESFDVVLSGLTYMQDAAEPIAETARVLRSGGRLALTMWAEDYLEFRLMCAAKRRLGLDPYPRPEPDAAVQRLLDAGFAAVKRQDFELAPVYASVRDYLAYRRGFGVPVGSTQEDHDRFLAALGDEAARVADADGAVTQGWAFSLITARRAS
jgi:SAM-dependent methyltransferase